MTRTSRPTLSASLGDLLAAARTGKQEALGELLEFSRSYLHLIANQELEAGLRPKLAAADVVQQTFLEAQTHFDEFQGNSQAALLAWLRQILRHNLADVRRHYVEAEKRSISRERSLESDHPFTSAFAKLPAKNASPSAELMREEQAALVDRALSQLSATDQEVLRLRHEEQLKFAEIGQRMNRSPDAARMLWWRAFEKLVQRLKPFRDFV